MAVSEVEVFSSLESVVIQGDLSRLSTKDRVVYYKKVCESLGLNPLTKPFDYLVLKGKTMLYARKDATEQLRKIHGISIRISSRELTDDVYVVTAQASDKNGRTDESIGAVNLSGLKGEEKANAMMKCETKAKRRVTLSIAGLGMLDETEVATIPNAKFISSECDGDAQTDSREFRPSIEELRKLIIAHGVSKSEALGWLAAEGVSRISELSESTVQSIIRSFVPLRNEKQELVKEG